MYTPMFGTEREILWQAKWMNQLNILFTVASKKKKNKTRKLPFKDSILVIYVKVEKLWAMNLKMFTVILLFLKNLKNKNEEIKS